MSGAGYLLLEENGVRQCDERPIISWVFLAESMILTLLSLGLFFEQLPRTPKDFQKAKEPTKSNTNPSHRLPWLKYRL